MRKLALRAASSIVIAAACQPAISAATPAAPLIDPPGPFSFPAKPTDIIGVTNYPSGTMVTPEGFLFTDFGELMFLAGAREAPIAQRIRQLRDGHLPIVEYAVVRDGVRYAFTAFASRVDGKPDGTVVDFVRVRATNVSHGAATAVVASGFRFSGDGIRYDRPRKPERLGDHYHLGTKFNKDWTYGADGSGVVRDGRLVYAFPRTRPHDIRYRIGDKSIVGGTLRPRTLAIGPKTPAGIVRYRVALKPGEAVDLDWAVPVLPVAAGSVEADAVTSAHFDEHLAKVSSGWNEILADGMQIDLPEEKVVDTVKASLIYDLIARYTLDGMVVQTVNDFQYHAFFLRDAAFFTNMYLQTGYPKIARATLDFFARMQRPDGLFLSQDGQYDGVGQTLWIYGRYVEMTGDRDFAEKVYPSVARAVEWIRRARASEPQGILPASDPHDNEDISGHITGYNFWALAGLAEAAKLAELTGHDAEAAGWRAEHDAYRARFIALLRKQTALSGGYIPPGLDGKGGQDWDNMASIYPTSVLTPDDPMVRATLKATRAKYQEGLPLWRGTLHNYNGFTNAETALILGEQQMAVGDLYAALVHTTATHGGFEVGPKPWGDREYGFNVTPHGWFAARYRMMLRDMLVREQGDDLHLLSAVSPSWIVPGSPLSIARAPTMFGPLDYTLTSDANGADLTLSTHFHASPKTMVVHIPWFVTASAAVVDGHPAAIEGDRLVLPLDAHHVRLNWQRNSEPMLSYESAVTKLKAEYRRRQAARAVRRK